MAFENITAVPDYLAKNNGSNTGLLFYRSYYEGQRFPAKNEKLEAQPLYSLPNPAEGFVNQSFRLKSNYPGILIGSGYLHEVKEEDDAIKIGFYFDHASGMPVLPGSSVKGTIRGAFPQFTEDEERIGFDPGRVNELSHLKEEDRMAIKKALPLKHQKALLVHMFLLHDFEKENLTEDELRKIHAFEREVFDGRRHSASNTEASGNAFRSIYERDIFFEAVPIAILKENKGNEKRLFGTDYLTPHKNKDKIARLDPFSDPTPLKFFKVMPEVVYEFRFKLVNSEVFGQVDAAAKARFFQTLIERQGIGAKTNVGYGNLSSEVSQPRAAAGQQQGETYQGNVQQASKPALPLAAIPASKLTRDSKIIGVLESVAQGKAIFTLSNVTELNCPIIFEGRVPDAQLVGKSFHLKVNNIEGPKGKPSKIKVGLASALPID